MQNVSAEFVRQINKSVRNRGHIKVTIGLINQDAQNNATVNNGQNTLMYFSVPKANNVFGHTVDPQFYATDERNFTKVDGSMYFAPPNGSSTEFYDNGIVSMAIGGEVKITFGDSSDLEISGLSIVFGEPYPTAFRIITDTENLEFTQQSSSVFTTDHLFSGVSYMIIRTEYFTNNRLRILGIDFGIGAVFKEQDITDFKCDDYVSPISDSVPSRDMSITFDNRDKSFTPDNEEGLVRHLEAGQKIEVGFGYDLDIEGNSQEWIPTSIVGYLSSWSANNSVATFVITDLLDRLSLTTYTRGKFISGHYSLYNLAVDVLTDAGLTSDDYIIDDIYSYPTVALNPMPLVSHAEALQIIANAAHVALKISRDGKIEFDKYSATRYFYNWTATSNGETEESDVSKVIHFGSKDKSENKNYYSESVYIRETLNECTAIVHGGYSVVGNTLIASSLSGARVVDNTLVMPYVDVEAHKVDYWEGDVPVISISPRVGILIDNTVYQMTIKFIDTYPRKITLRSYNSSNELTREVVCLVDGLTLTISDYFPDVSRIDIEFTEGDVGQRIQISDIILDDTLGACADDSELKEFPVSTRQKKLASIVMERDAIKRNPDASVASLKKGTIVATSPDETYKVLLDNPSYDIDNHIIITGASARIVFIGVYCVEFQFPYITEETTVTYDIQGKEYTVIKHRDSITLNPKGDTIAWYNPIVRDESDSQELATWINQHYDNDTTYDASWRGDPRVDSGDLINMETVMGKTIPVRLVRNSLSYNGAWSGSFQARKTAYNVV